MVWESGTIITAIFVYVGLLLLQQAFRRQRIDSSFRYLTTFLVWALPILFPPIIWLILWITTATIEFLFRQDRISGWQPTSKQGLTFISCALLSFSLSSYHATDLNPRIIVIGLSLLLTIALLRKYYIYQTPV